ncbi:MAG: hypothetical protein NVS2B16_11730 [Chloroflexota bacterium]
MTLVDSTTAVDPGIVRVLIADDDPRVRHALRALIESSSGITVVGEAGSSDELLECDRTLDPEVILLDLILSGKEEHFDLLRILGQEGRSVVAISVRGGLRQLALDAGACAFVEKGATPDVVLQALQYAAAHQRALHGDVSGRGDA